MTLEIMTDVIIPIYFNLRLNLESTVFYPLKYFPGIGYINHNVYSLFSLKKRRRLTDFIDEQILVSLVHTTKLKKLKKSTQESCEGLFSLYILLPFLFKCRFRINFNTKIAKCIFAHFFRIILSF
jgi:hypothetical protein